MVNERLVTAKGLNEVEVLGAGGKRTQLLGLVGQDTPAVVVFLRHLG